MKLYSKILSWIKGLFNDENGNPSSKRFVGVLCGVSLCVSLFINEYTCGAVKPADNLVDAVTLLAFGCLGLASVDKIWAKKSSSAKKS